MLFDISPDEPQPKKKTGKSRARVKAAPPPAEVAAPVLAPYFIGERPIPALGTIDGEHVCADDSCAAGSHDILAEFDGEWTVECALCGTQQRVAAIRDHLKPKGDVFVVSDGRFAGMTLDEISRQPRGPEWLAWAVAEHPRQFVREAVQKHALTVAR